MSDQNNINQDKPMDHAYDGIQEYDNPLPEWWLWTFYVTIIFGFMYWIHYEFGGGQTTWDEMKQDLAAIEKLQKKNPSAGDSDEELLALEAKYDVLAEGKAVYDAKCSACHGPQLQGLIGPNLVDEFWINGKGLPKDIMVVVRKGVLDKGMPAWDGLLKPEEMKAVTAFVRKHRGTQPPNAKPPQGERVVSN